MGSAASGPTRTYTVENPQNVIQLSDNVVKRLKNQLNEIEKENVPVHSEQVASNSVPSQPGQVTQIVYANSPTTSSLDFKREKEDALRKNDLYWQGRINQIEWNNSKTPQIYEKEFNESVQNVKGMFVTPSNKSPSASCDEQKKRLMECYKKNKRELLLCSNYVQEFSDCVDSYRHKVLDGKAK